MADEPTDPPVLQAAPANGTPTENTNGNGDENGDNEPVRPTTRPNATRKKRRRKTKKTHNPQDVIYGPSFKPVLIYQKLIFAIAVTTYFLTHSWQDDKTKPLRIVYISPLSLLFCKYCGVIFRSPETLHAHFNKGPFVPSGIPGDRTVPCDFCTRGYKCRVRTVDPQPENKSTLELYKLSEDDKWEIHDIAGQAVIQHKRAMTVQPPLGLRHYLRPANGDKLDPNPAQRVWEIRRGTVNMNDRDDDDFNNRFPNQKKNPNVLWDTDPKNFLGRAPFMLVSSSIKVPSLQKWIERKFGPEMKSVWLVACDECTVFGCMGCGVITANAQRVTDCMKKCFDYEPGENTAAVKIQYNQDGKGYKPHLLVCEFAEEISLTDVHDNINKTGKENASKLPPQRGRKPSDVREQVTEEETTSTDKEVHHFYVDFEELKKAPTQATAVTPPDGQNPAQNTVARAADEPNATQDSVATPVDGQNTTQDNATAS